MKISYAITVCTEVLEVKRLLERLQAKIQKGDEIVILHDRSSTSEKTGQVEQLLRSIANFDSRVSIYEGRFNGNFAFWKNKITSCCVGDYIFQLDADELPHEFLLESLPDILRSNSTVEMFLVPRVNTVKGITKEHIQKWGWQQSDAGWINWPDYQTRIYRNKSQIQWGNKVHERLEGYKTFSSLPESEEFCIYHHKTIEKQESQNNYYEKLLEDGTGSS